VTAAASSAPVPVPAPVPAPLDTVAGRAAFTPADWAIFTTIAAIWGASFLFIAIGLESLQPGVVTLLRVGLGATILNLLPGGRIQIQRSDWGRMLAVSILWVGIPFTLFPIAEQRINSAVTGLLNGATPMFVALFAVLFFGRRTSGPQLLGVGVGFVGIVLISAPSLGEGSTQAAGVGLVLLATLCYGIATNLVVPLQLRYGARAVMSRMLGLATIWTLPLGLVSLRDSHVELAPILAVSVLGLVGTGLAFLLMGTLVGRVGATRASFITYLVPVVALALGVVFQDDHVAAPALVGVALVVLGAVLASRKEA
jgi:drug/metabolite transporter (DMT)-like permease